MQTPSPVPHARGTDDRERDRVRHAHPLAYAEGYAAGSNGLDPSVNPYRKDTDQHSAWTFGYEDATSA